MLDTAARELIQYQRSPLLFIERMWSLIPQPAKPEYRTQLMELQLASWENWAVLKKKVSASWFGDWDEEAQGWKWHDFTPGKHLTWQQWLVLLGVQKAVNGDAPRHLTITSGHGIGKSSTSSLIVLWFLYCFKRAQVPCTAPTSSQMHDVLWKELSLWINKMPGAIKTAYDWQSGYIRMRADPESWFARARTSTKENTEAIAGVHSDHVLINVDEASGVPEQVYNTAEGAMTSKNVFIVLYSNPTKTTGYFYDTHHRYSSEWQAFQFSSIDSPIVDKGYVARQRTRHGENSEEYGIRVLGKFPNEGMMDDSGYLQLIPADRITIIPRSPMYEPFIGRKILGIDPSGEGKDKATYVVRDHFHIQKVHEELTSNPRKIAQNALTLMARYGIRAEDVVVGSFGVGTDVGKEIAIASQGRYNIYSVLEGNHPEYEEKYNTEFFKRVASEMDEQGQDLYLNLRALMFFRLRVWIIGGGTIVDDNTEDSEFKQELVVQRYKRTLQGNKIQMMSKKEMMKLRIKSPNIADAAALTMLRVLDDGENDPGIEEEDNDYDKHEPL